MTQADMAGVAGKLAWFRLVQIKGSNGKGTSVLFASSKGLQGSDMESSKIAGGDGKSNIFVD